MHWNTKIVAGDIFVTDGQTTFTLRNTWAAGDKLRNYLNRHQPRDPSKGRAALFIAGLLIGGLTVGLGFLFGQALGA